MQIYFKTEFSECTLKINTLDLKSNNLYSFLDNLGTYLDLVNDGHDAYNPISRQVTKKVVKTIKYEWDPYNYLNIQKNYSFYLNNLKRNSVQYYKTNTFNSQSLNITKEHIIDVICQEL